MMVSIPEGVIRRAAIVLSLAACTTACLAPPTAANLPTRLVPGAGDGAERRLVVMLPGLGDRIGIFEARGFVDGPLPFDSLLVDAHFGYYMEEVLIERLHQDVVLPARAAGYDRIVFVGVSLGGLGALLYADAHPGQIDGLVLIAPYLGDGDAAAAVRAAGGLSSWDREAPRAEVWELAVWRRLASIAEGTDGTPLVLAYGEADDFAADYPLITVASCRVVSRPGGHSWAVWTALWDELQREGEAACRALD